MDIRIEEKTVVRLSDGHKFKYVYDADPEIGAYRTFIKLQKNGYKADELLLREIWELNPTKFQNYKPVIKKEELAFAVNYGDMMDFIADNCDIKDEDKAWEFAENLTNSIMSEETVVHFNHEQVKNDTYMEKNGLDEEKKWLLKFFDAHPFIKKFVLYFND